MPDFGRPTFNTRGSVNTGIRVIEMESGRRKTRRIGKRYAPVEDVEIITLSSNLPRLWWFFDDVGAKTFEWEFCSPSDPTVKKVHLCKLLSDVSYSHAGYVSASAGNFAPMTRVAFTIEISEVNKIEPAQPA